MHIKAEAIRVSGACNAQIREGDTYLVSGTDVLPPSQGRTCSLLAMSIALNAGRLRLGNGPLFVSCPDPGTGDGGNVIVKLSVVEP
jgi:uncharacterized repeat protein (TIGR04076 family)